jgi:sigma-B regulation protein RsbU (phosphoserine phosphatase)
LRSSKGVPAALFMVIAKTLIKNNMQMDKSVEEALTDSNTQLSENNEELLFVTAWVSVVDLNTGAVEYSDAGHEFALVAHPNGTVEEIRPAKKKMPLAAMEGMTYLRDSFELEVGDKLFLYTDGVPEATNASEEMYGMERLKKVLGEHALDKPADILKAVRKDVDAFVGDAPQFDDLTMLAFERK